MALKPEVLDALLAAGATAEMIVAAVKADMIDEERRRDQKRANDAARQRKSRSIRRGHDASRNVTVTECDPPNDIYSNPPVSSDEETIPPARRSRVAGPAKPDGVKDQTWADFVGLRKRKRADLTETALEAIKREAIRAGWSLEAALAECVARGWQAFKADWVKDSPKPAAAANDFDPLMRSIRALKARESSA